MNRLIFSRLCFPCYLVSLFLLLSSGVLAQWSTDPSQNSPVCTTLNNQSIPKIISDGTGGAIIGWEVQVNAPDKRDIYAQRIDSLGILRWDASGVAICSNPQDQFNCRIVPDGSGGALIAWEDRRFPKNQVFAQKINSEGKVLWTLDGVTVGTVQTHFQQSDPVLCSDLEGGVIIAFADWRGDLYNGKLSINAQRISANGEILWIAGGVQLNIPTEGSSGSPRILSDGNGGAIVTWDQWYGTLATGNRNIGIQKIDKNGDVLWGENGILLCNQVNEQRFPELTTDGRGGAIVIWEDYRNDNKGYIYAQKIENDGTIKWVPNGIPLCLAGGSGQKHHRIVSDNRGGVIIAWENSYYFTSLQRINSTGEILWAEDGIGTGSNESRFPELVAIGDSGVIVTWQDTRVNVLAQRIDTTGKTMWASKGITVSNANKDQLGPVITGGSNLGGIIVWTDLRNSSADIYAQRINIDGTLGTVTGTGYENMEHHHFSLGQNYPNPFINQTNIDFTLDHAGYVSIKVYNARGEEVFTLINTDLGSGKYTVEFDAKNLPGGTYFYRIYCEDRSITKTMLLNK